MKLKPFKRTPVLIAFGVILLVCLARCGHWELFERPERMTFDMRARQALRFAPTVATNLGFVFIDEESLKAVWNGSLGYRFGQLWPRQVYGRLVQELAEQGVKAIAFDIILAELRPDHPPVQMADGNLVESDEFFARQMRLAGNVIIALTKQVTPPALFRTNALAVGDITTEKDPDGVLRRVQVLRPNWHLAFRQAATELGLDLDRARVEPRQVVVPCPGDKDFVVHARRRRQFRPRGFRGRQNAAGHGAQGQTDCSRQPDLAHGCRAGSAGVEA